jgi:hypothetical protein
MLEGKKQRGPHGTSKLKIRDISKPDLSNRA